MIYCNFLKALLDWEDTCHRLGDSQSTEYLLQSEIWPRKKGWVLRWLCETNFYDLSHKRIFWKSESTNQILQPKKNKDPRHMKLLNTAPEIYELKPAGNNLIFIYICYHPIHQMWLWCLLHRVEGKQTCILIFFCILWYALGAVTYLTDISLSFWNL